MKSLLNSQCLSVAEHVYSLLNLVSQAKIMRNDIEPYILTSIFILPLKESPNFFFFVTLKELKKKKRKIAFFIPARYYSNMYY